MIALTIREPTGSRSERIQEDRIVLGGSVEGARRLEVEGWPGDASLEILRVGPRYLVFDTSPEPRLRLEGQPRRRGELRQGARLQVGDVCILVEELDTRAAPAAQPLDAVICYSPATGSFYAEPESPNRLRVESGAEAGLEILVPGEGVLIGRDPQCDLRLSDPKISARHARILRVGGEHVLRDLESRNGTFLGPRRISSEVLSEGDEIRLGTTRLRFLPLEEPPELSEAGLAPTATDELMIFRVPQVLAHEIRNYLSVVGLSCERLAESARRDDGRVPTALRNISQARGQIEHLLGLLRLASSEPRRERCDLAAVITEQLAMMEPELLRRGLRLELDLERPLPVRVDPRQIGQVLLNLLRNAGQVAEEGSAVRVGARRTGDRVRFEVADRGPGIPREDREKVFTPFFTTKPEGTGLGLYVSREILRRHGGLLWMEEAPGGGALAIGTLPTGEEPAGGEPDGNAEEEPHG